MAHDMSLQGVVDLVVSRGWTWTRLLIAALIIHGATVFVSRIRDHHEASSFARRHDCRPPPELTKRWPLGIDRIKQIWDANADGRLLAFFCSVASGYEPRNTIQQFFLIGPRTYNVLDPENVEAILATNFQDYGFGTRPAVFAPLLGNGIFTQEGAPWKHSRDLLRKQFARAQYQKLGSAFCEHVDNLIATLPRDGGVVDLQPLFFRLTLDVASSLLFGKSVYSLRADTDQNAQNKLFAESFNIAQEGLAKRFRLAPFHHFYNPPAFRQACRNVHRFVEEYIEERGLVLNDSTARPASSEEDERTSWFIEQVAAESTSAVDLRDQLLNILLAGRDTTACCPSWCCRLLVRHPAVLQRLREEAAAVMGTSKSPTREHIQQMPFLSYIIKETLRLYPSVPLNVREALRTTMMPTGGGPDGSHPILVRKGEVVVFSQYITSRKKNVYGQDADEFRPERWETGELNGVASGYFPFNSGPRRCLGEDFALMEVSYTLVRLLQEFLSIQIPPGEAVEKVGSERQVLTLVLSSADGCRVTLERSES